MKHRLLNCEFLLAGSFNSMSNKAKLLYLTMMISADDRGFVDNTLDLINGLENNEKEHNKGISLELLENTYKSGLMELLNRGYLYEFQDRHNNRIHLIRHWFLHNKYVPNLRTNYRNLLNQVHIENGKYYLGERPKEEEQKVNVVGNDDNDNWDNLLDQIDNKEGD